MNQLKEIIQKPSISLFILEYSLYACLINFEVTWYPYFFTVMGLAAHAQKLSSIPSLAYLVAPLILEPLYAKYPSRTNPSIIFMLILNVGTFIWLIVLSNHIADPALLPLLFFLVALESFLFADTYGRCTSL